MGEPMQRTLYMCTPCRRTYVQHASLLIHWGQKHHASSADPVPCLQLQLGDVIAHCSSSIEDFHTFWYWKCRKCGYEHYDARKIVEHISINTDSIEISCIRKDPDADLLKPSQENILLEEEFGVPAQHYCQKCKKDIVGLSAIAEHRKVHIKQFLCDVCGESFASWHSRKTHIVTHHQTEPRERNLVCDQCGKRFSNPTSFRCHHAVHITVRAFHCKVCSKAFKTRRGLVKHESTHLGLKPFTCDVCGQSFTRPDNLKIHARIHSGERPYKCTLCDAAFAQLTSLNVHKKKHETLHVDISHFM